MSRERPAWSSDALTLPGGRPWDLLVVGGGTAGIVAAQTAAGFGADVLLVERDRTGGDCLWSGCVPSKAILAAAHAAAQARAAAELGVHVGTVEVDFAAVMRHVRASIATIEPVDSPEALRRAGARVARGVARFSGPHTATVDGEPVRFGQALVATGSTPVVPDLPGLADADPLTSETVWSLQRLPERLLVLGAGAIGCELGQGMARLGSRVTLVESAARVLPSEDPLASATLSRAFAQDAMEVRTGVGLHHVEHDGSESVGVLDDGTRVRFDRVLVAVGRRPRTADLGLALAGVELDRTGHVVVDDRLRTTNPRIWAAGDLTGHPAFTHVAGVHGSLAASNAVLGLRRTVQPDLVPRVTYTQPEVAAFGPSVDARTGLTALTTHHDEVDRAIVEGRTDGHSTLVLDRSGRVVGATVVAPRAGEILAEALLAGQQRLRARAVAGTMHAYPTWSDGIWKAGMARTRADLAAPTMRRVSTALVTLRRRWVAVTARPAASEHDVSGPPRPR